VECPFKEKGCYGTQQLIIMIWFLNQSAMQTKANSCIHHWQHSIPVLDVRATCIKMDSTTDDTFIISFSATPKWVMSIKITNPAKMPFHVLAYFHSLVVLWTLRCLLSDFSWYQVAVCINTWIRVICLLWRWTIIPRSWKSYTSLELTFNSGCLGA